MTATLPPKLESIVRLALCPSAPAGEWQAAAVAFFRVCRSGEINPLAIAPAPSEPPPPPRWAAQSPVMRFGKFKGQTARWIARNEPAYAQWAIDNISTMGAFFRDALKRELEEAWG